MLLNKSSQKKILTSKALVEPSETEAEVNPWGFGEETNRGGTYPLGAWIKTIGGWKNSFRGGAETVRRGETLRIKKIRWWKET
jgi:hypothetical protein